MSPSQLLVLRLVTAGGLVLAADAGTELQVLRVSRNGRRPGSGAVGDARYGGTRWTLVPGTHRIRALGAGGQQAEISITVE